MGEPVTGQDGLRGGAVQPPGACRTHSATARAQEGGCLWPWGRLHPRMALRHGVPVLACFSCHFVSSVCDQKCEQGD